MSVLLLTSDTRLNYFSCKNRKARSVLPLLLRVVPGLLNCSLAKVQPARFPDDTSSLPQLIPCRNEKGDAFTVPEKLECLFFEGKTLVECPHLSEVHMYVCMCVCACTCMYVCVSISMHGFVCVESLKAAGREQSLGPSDKWTMGAG